MLVAKEAPLEPKDRCNFAINTGLLRSQGVYFAEPKLQRSYLFIGNI
ncbi:hypothetical protein ABIB50_002454 [Mucilaginibacter sp. UYCu711]